MLKPYTRPYQSQKRIKLPFAFTVHQVSERRGATARKMMIVMLALSSLSFFTSDFFFGPLENFAAKSRQLCNTYFIGDFSNDPYWENSFPATTDHDGNPRILPSGNTTIGFVVTLDACPDDTSYQNAIYGTDPGHSLYDAAAVLKHSIEKNLAVVGKYTATMHAIVHPDAIVCTNPNGETYDRISVMENLGYFVTIRGSPLLPALTADYDGSTIQTNSTTLAADAGDRDLTKLFAASDLDSNEVVVMTDFDTVMMQPLDPLLDDFIADDASVAFSTEPAPGIETFIEMPSSAPVIPGPPTSTPSLAPSLSVAPSMAPSASPAPSTTQQKLIPPDQVVDTSIILVKPDADLVNTLTDIYTNTPYDPVTGWNGTGIGNYTGGLGAQGLLTYYYADADPSKVKILDHCTYGNDHQGNCLEKPTEEVVVAKLSSKCGAPWTCPDLSALLDSEKAQCESFEKYWYTMRQDFEDNCWIGPTSQHTGTYQSNVTMGFCSGSGALSYERLIPDKKGPLACDLNTVTTTTTMTMPLDSGLQNQVLTLTHGETTGQAEACVSGVLTQEGFEPPYNIAVVLDTSQSTSSPFDGSPVGDVNNDGLANRIIDAEIASTMELLYHLGSSRDLGNDNVNIGLVTFATEAVYHGMYKPVDPSNPQSLNPELTEKLVNLRSGGNSHFDDALDKAIDFFLEAPVNRRNIMIFLSDGLPNVPGDGDNEDPVLLAGNTPDALIYDSELNVLDNLQVKRMCIGVGPNSDVRDGFGLDKIDNTPNGETGQRAEQVSSTDALTEAVLRNPIGGKNISNFEILINGIADPRFNVNNVVSGPLGYMFEDVIGGLDPTLGEDNSIDVAVTVDSSGTGEAVKIKCGGKIKGGLSDGKKKKRQKSSKGSKSSKSSISTCDVCEADLGNKMSKATGPNAMDTFPTISNRGIAGRDDSVNFLLGGSYFGNRGAEIEGAMVVLGDFTIEKYGPSNIVRVGAGSQVVPNGGRDSLLVGGNLNINREVGFMDPVGGDPAGTDLSGNIIYAGSEKGKDRIRINGEIRNDPSLDLSEWTTAFEHLEVKSEYWASLPANGRWKNNWGTITVSAGDGDCVQVFNIEPGEFDFSNTYGQVLKYDSSMNGRTILFNVQADKHGYAAVTNFANFYSPNGSNGHHFDPRFSKNIIWNIHGAKEVSLGVGGSGNGEFIGSVLVATPNSKLTMAYPGTSGRMIVNGDVLQNRAGSEFHNYDFDPVCPLPLPDCCNPSGGGKGGSSKSSSKSSESGSRRRIQRQYHTTKRKSLRNRARGEAWKG